MEILTYLNWMYCIKYCKCKQHKLDKQNLETAQKVDFRYIKNSEVSQPKAFFSSVWPSYYIM